MKKNLILLVVLLVLAGLTSVLFMNDSKNTIASNPLSDFAVSDTASVSRIFISDKVTGQLELRRDESKGHWIVNEKYRAKGHAVKLLLEAFKNIKIKGPVPNKMKPMVLSNAASTGKKIEIYTNSSAVPEKIWISAGNTSDHHGDYFILEIPGEGISPDPFIVDMPMFAGFLTARFFTAENDWRYSGVFDYPQLEFNKIKVEQKDSPSQGFILTWEGGNEVQVKELVSGMPISPLDTLIAKDYILRYKKIHLETHNNYLQPYQIDSVLSLTPHWEITVTESSGNEQKLDLFHLAGNGNYHDFEGNEFAYNQDMLYGTLGDGELFKVQYGPVFKPLLVGLDYFK